MWKVLAHNGARMSLAARHAWPGVATLIFDVSLDAPSGWVTVSFERLAICLFRSEIGGRGRLSLLPDIPTGEYYGEGHLTVLAGSEPVTLGAHQLRRTRLACLLLEPDEV